MFCINFRSFPICTEPLLYFYVEKGQHIRQGEQFGLVGKTRRVTGAHLHWGMSLNNARVDPQLFIK